MEMGASCASASLIRFLNKWRKKATETERAWMKVWIDGREKYGAYNFLMRELALELPAHECDI